MPARDEAQRKAHEFLLKKFVANEPFTKEEFKQQAGWKSDTFDIHFGKQFETLLIEVEDDRFRVSEAFRRFVVWENFQKHVTQKRRVGANYAPVKYASVMQFEFFMPLANEGHLRTSLDALFYKDTIIGRLKTYGLQRIKEQFGFGGPATQTDEEYLQRVFQWITRTFIGYSISHVAGRFRATDLKSRTEAYEQLEQKLGRYLVDETTAVVRFIFPCGQEAPNTLRQPRFPADIVIQTIEDGERQRKQLAEQCDMIWFFFNILFVQSIVEFVNGEAEIWLLESGLRSNLHIWRQTDVLPAQSRKRRSSRRKAT